MNLAKALQMVAEWHRATLAGADPRAVSLDQIRAYRTLAAANKDREIA